MNVIFEPDTALRFASFFANDPVYPFANQLYKKLLEGHICLDLTEPCQAEINVISLDDLDKSSFISRHAQDIKPFIIQNNKLYLYKYWVYEERVIRFIQQSIANNALFAQRYETLRNTTIPPDLLDTFADLNQNTPYIDWQFIALVKSFLNGFSIITGGPGTGKTTTIAKLLQLLLIEKSDLQIALAAPTGKAAIRMKEALLNNANYQKINHLFSEPEGLTIHRLLGSIRDKHTFKHHKNNQLKYDVVVIDEASMVDLPLMSKLIQALPSTARLILLGDQNQLSAVGAGSLLKDLCDNVPNLTQISSKLGTLLSNMLHAAQMVQIEVQDQACLLENAITQLQVSRRFSNTSEIGKLSHAILTNGSDSLQSESNPIRYYFEPREQKDFVHIDLEYNEDYIDQFVRHYIEYIDESNVVKALEKLNTTRILCAVKESDHGVYKLNQRIENKLVSLNYIQKDKVFYNHMPIIITQNNPELNIFNGDIGLIRDGMAYFGTGDGAVMALQPALLTAHYETVFAMTIHKSQGSEFDNVLVILPQNLENKILTKQLLYTGVTRAKKRVIIQTQLPVLQQTLETEVTRISGISNRLKDL